MAKKKKKEEAKLAAEIKAMEDTKRKVVPIKQDKTISYNSWYHQRKTSIPKQHLKEVIWADMSARGIKTESTVEEFDKALELYGVTL